MKFIIFKELVDNQARDLEEKELVIQKLKTSLAAKDNKLQVGYVLELSTCLGYFKK